MATTFQVLHRFQENIVSKTAQIMNNFPKSSKNGNFVTMVTFLKHMFGFNSSSYVVKAEFFKKGSLTLILVICYSNIQSYFKIDLILTMLFNVYLLCQNS